MQKADRQIVGMRGVYLVAAELCKHDLIVAPTSRGARGADLLATDSSCKHAFSVQVKSTKNSFFLFPKDAKKHVSRDYIYVLVRTRKDELTYYVVPSHLAARRMKKAWNGGFMVDARSLTQFKGKWTPFL
jgi:hypothetical protein